MQQTVITNPYNLLYANCHKKVTLQWRDYNHETLTFFLQPTVYLRIATLSFKMLARRSYLATMLYN